MIKETKQHYFHSMDEYIQKTPKILMQLFSNRKELLKDSLSLIDAEVEEIILLGSGSSYTAALSAKYFLQEMMGKRIVLVYPNNVLRYEHFVPCKAIVIGISQSGNSVAAIEAVNKLKKNGYPSIALTSDPDSDIAKVADCVLDLSIGNESAGPKTLGYSATLFWLMMLALEYSYLTGTISEHRYEQECCDLQKTIQGLTKIHDEIEQWYQNHRETMIATSKISCVGYGANYGTAVEGSLKLIETVRCPAFGYEFEEFLHGPNDGIDRNSTIFLLGNQEDELERMSRLQQFANGITENCFLFTGNEINIKNVIRLSFSDTKNFSPLEYVAVLQYLAYAISRDRAVDLNTIKYPEYYSIMNCKTKI